MKRSADRHPGKPARARRLVRLVLLGAALVGSAGAWGAEDPASRPAKTKPSLSEQREANKLVAQYRRAKREPEKRAEAVAEAVRRGTVAVVAMRQAIQLDLEGPLTKYRAAFYRQAAAMLERRTRKMDLDEIARLRMAVRALAKDPALTKEKIVETADPALRRLEEIFLVRPAEVLAQSRDLPAERQKLLPLGDLRQICEAALPGDKPAAVASFEQYLEGEEALLVGLAMPMDAKTQETLAVNARLAPQIDDEEARCIQALNVARLLLGLNPVAIDVKLCAAARDHSKDMTERNFFSHDSPVPGKETPWRRAERFGTTASAENIFAGLRDGRAAHVGWFHSPGHHKNQMGDHKRVGVGRHEDRFTQLFGG